MHKSNVDPTNENDNSKKLECLHNLWLALKDRYTNEYSAKELGTNDCNLRKTEH
jgi:hypothetical protein